MRTRTGAAAAIRPARPPLAPGSVRNVDIAAAFDETADLLDIQQANPFRVRAYRNAARMLRSHKREMSDLLAPDGDPDELPGSGTDLASKIRELVETGKCTMLERLVGELPKGLVVPLKLPGLGPKRVHALHHELGIALPGDLQRALKRGQLDRVSGFGAKLAARIGQALAGPATAPRRYG